MPKRIVVIEIGKGEVKAFTLEDYIKHLNYWQATKLISLIRLRKNLGKKGV